MAPASDEKVNLTSGEGYSEEGLGLGGVVKMLVSGPVVSIVQVRVAGSPILPAPSIALARKVWEESARDGKDCGEVQDDHPAESMSHWKEATPDPASVPLKVKSAVVDATLPAGPESMVASGGVVSDGRAVSTVHVRDAGLGSVLLTPSVARTWKVCGPSARPA